MQLILKALKRVSFFVILKSQKIKILINIVMAITNKRCYKNRLILFLCSLFNELKNICSKLKVLALWGC
ncbi:hypothetical protein CRN53_09095 [Vibrio vulnificus]|nr:hypothetical protein CRN53_09095 [Vibrio vulnificus]